MNNPVRTLCEPMGIEISDKQRSLKKNETGDPDRSRSAKYRQELLGGDGLDKEEQKGGEKDCASKKGS